MKVKALNPFPGIYLTTVMSMTSVSVIMTVFVLNLHHRGPNRGALPKWMRDIMKCKNKYFPCKTPAPKKQRLPFKGIRNLESLLLTINNKLKRIPFNKKKSFRSTENYFSDYSDRFQNQVDTPDIKLKSFPTMDTDVLSGSFTANHEYDPMFISDDDYRCIENLMRSNSISVSSSSRQCLSCNFLINPSSPTVDKAISTDAYPFSSSDQQEINTKILTALNKILIKHELEELNYNSIQEWREVAQFVDRLLFWLYLFSTSASTIIILVIAPVFEIIPIKIIDPLEIRMNLTSFANSSDGT